MVFALFSYLINFDGSSSKHHISGYDHHRKLKLDSIELYDKTESHTKRTINLVKPSLRYWTSKVLRFLRYPVCNHLNSSWEPVGVEDSKYLNIDLDESMKEFDKDELRRHNMWLQIFQAPQTIIAKYSWHREFIFIVGIQFWHICFTPPSLSLYFSVSLLLSPTISPIYLSLSYPPHLSLSLLLSPLFFLSI